MSHPVRLNNLGRLQYHNDINVIMPARWFLQFVNEISVKYIFIIMISALGKSIGMIYTEGEA